MKNQFEKNSEPFFFLSSPLEAAEESESESWMNSALLKPFPDPADDSVTLAAVLDLGPALDLVLVGLFPPAAALAAFLASFLAAFTFSSPPSDFHFSISPS